jgi:hypothetical protein
MTKDLFNNVVIKNALNTQAIATDTTTAGAIIDTAGFESLTFAVQSGTLTDGSYTVLLQEGDNSGLSDAEAVADSDLLGTEAGASFALADDNKVTKIGYLGTKRYVRLSLVSADTTTGGTLGAVAILGHARFNPNSTQKV